MTSRKKAEPKEGPKATEAGASKPESTPSKPPADGGLAALQAKADADTARGYIGPEKESA